MIVRFAPSLKWSFASKRRQDLFCVCRNLTGKIREITNINCFHSSVLQKKCWQSLQISLDMLTIFKSISKFQKFKAVQLKL